MPGEADPLGVLSPRAAETVRWALEEMAAEAPAAADDSRLARVAGANWRNPARLTYALRFSKVQIGDFGVRGAQVGDGDHIEVELLGRKDRLWRARFHLDARARIVEMAVMRPPPPGITLRPARAGDWAALAELEGATPTRTAKGKSASLFRGDGLADRVEEFDFSFDEDEPPDLSIRGVYVDALYF